MQSLGDYDEEYDFEFGFGVVGSGLASTTFNHRIASEEINVAFALESSLFAPYIGCDEDEVEVDLPMLFLPCYNLLVLSLIDPSSSN